MTGISARRDYSNATIHDLQTKLEEASRLVGDTASVCMTGSFGRLEAGPHSDLDLFIVSDAAKSTDERAALSNLDSIVIKADLVKAAQRLGLKRFDGDGKYLVHHTSADLIENLGGPEDDASNTFTSRLLLLLEGRPLIGNVAFDAVVDAIIQSYWRDYANHETSFAPAFMTNDILRLWRTFCVNYEARTAATPHSEKRKRRVKNYKLKFSRLLTCYSALLSILHCYNTNGTVKHEDMKQICLTPPLQRIERLASLISDDSETVDGLNAIIAEYDAFLDVTNVSEEELRSQFDIPERQTELLQNSYVFATSIFGVIGKIGKGTKLHRMLVV